MSEHQQLPEEFLRLVASLETSYLQSDDPIRQSGFGGGAKRWREEREPILDAVDGDGDLLDIGCANGFLLESLVAWGQERGLALIPFGLDLGERLIARARARMPRFAANFFAGNGWDWEPPRRFRYVYTLSDCVPPAYFAEYARRLLARVVAPEGRLIVGSYGSFSRQIAPADVAALLDAAGLVATGESGGGDPIMARFAWTGQHLDLGDPGPWDFST